MQPAELPPLRVPAAKRLVAIGDLHGDLEKVITAAVDDELRHCLCMKVYWLTAYLVRLSRLRYVHFCSVLVEFVGLWFPIFPTSIDRICSVLKHVV